MAVVHSQPLPLPPWMRQEDPAVCKWLISEATAGLKCADIIHLHEDSCAAALSGSVRDVFIGASKFYVPFYAMYFIWNSKKTLNGDKAFYRKMAYFFARSMTFTVLAGALCSISGCTVMRLTGFTYWISIITGTIGGLSILAEHPFRRRIVINTLINLTLNYLYRRAQMSELLPQRSAVVETAFFMAVNGLLLHLLHKARAENKKTSVFWFYIPDAVGEKQAQRNSQKCPVPHRGSCWNSTVKETAKFSALAAALQLLRLLLMSRGGWSPAAFFSRKTVASIISTGGYVFLYKFVRCSLGTRFQTDRSEHSALAGLAAGSAFWFQPNTTILFSAVIAATQILLEFLPGRLKAASQWPMPELLGALCQGILVHARTHDLSLCPKFAITMMDIITNNRARDVQNAYIKHLQQFEANVLKS